MTRSATSWAGSRAFERTGLDWPAVTEAYVETIIDKGLGGAEMPDAGQELSDLIGRLGQH